jgi:hypothetical protein
LKTLRLREDFAQRHGVAKLAEQCGLVEIGDRIDELNDVPGLKRRLIGRNLPV